MKWWNVDEAYYKYLHKAMKIKQNNRSETLFTSCLKGIDHIDIIKAYKSAKVNTEHHELDIDRLKNIINKKIKTNNDTINKFSNKKEELIIMCNIELSSML